MRDHVKLKGFVVIRQGERILARSRNHFVRGGLMCLAHFLAYDASANYAGGQFDIYCGTDTATPTTIDMTELTAKINTPRDDGALSDYTITTGWEAKISATWDAGEITDTIGEAGLYLYSEYDLAMILFSRLSVQDGDFYPFTPDPALPLTVDWYVRFTFE